MLPCACACVLNSGITKRITSESVYSSKCVCLRNLGKEADLVIVADLWIICKKQKKSDIHVNGSSFFNQIHCVKLYIFVVILHSV